MHLYRVMEDSITQQERKRHRKVKALQEHMNQEIDLLLGQIDVQTEQEIQNGFLELTNLLTGMKSDVVLAERRNIEAGLVVGNLSRIFQEI